MTNEENRARNIVHDTVESIRKLLDAARSSYGDEEWADDDGERKVIDLVTLDEDDY